MNSKLHKLDKLLSFQRKKYFIKSFFRKANRLIVDFLPLTEINSKYCIENIVVKNAEKAVTFAPKEFDKNEKIVETSTFPIIIYALKDVFFTTNASYFLTKNLKEIYFEKLHEDERDIYLYNSENLLFHGDKLVKLNNLPKFFHDIEAVFFGGIFTNNYYHFLFEIISKAEYLEKIPGSKNLDIVLDISIQQNNNLKTVAEFFLKGYNLLYLRQDQYHSFKKLWFITAPNSTIPNVIEGIKYESKFTKISPESVSYIRSVCLKNYDATKVSIDKVSKVFIARKSIFRKYNEIEVLEIAKKYGFKAVYFEDLNIHEQIFVLQNADYVLGSSGAAWTNLVFAKENSKGLMWLGTVWGEFSVFSTLAKLVHFDLYVMRHKSKTTDFHEDYILDPIELEINIKKLLEL